jgi:hypothetical protein
MRNIKPIGIVKIKKPSTSKETKERKSIKGIKRRIGIITL